MGFVKMRKEKNKLIVELYNPQLVKKMNLIGNHGNTINNKI